VYQLGKTAAGMLIARIRSKDDETKDHKFSIKTLDTGLVIRKSVK
jgi:DNA-binding LacI/PurR family transcriptional regulator